MKGEGFNTEIQNDEDRRKEIFIKKVVAAHDKIATILRVNQQERDKKISEYTVSYPIFYFNVQNIIFSWGPKYKTWKEIEIDTCRY